jgi:hypothetical protein
VQPCILHIHVHRHMKSFFEHLEHLAALTIPQDRLMLLPFLQAGYIASAMVAVDGKIHPADTDSSKPADSSVINVAGAKGCCCVRRGVCSGHRMIGIGNTAVGPCIEAAIDGACTTTNWTVKILTGRRDGDGANCVCPVSAVPDGTTCNILKYNVGRIHSRCSFFALDPNRSEDHR